MKNLKAKTLTLGLSTSFVLGFLLAPTFAQAQYHAPLTICESTLHENSGEKFEIQIYSSYDSCNEESTLDKTIHQATVLLKGLDKESPSYTFMNSVVIMATHTQEGNIASFYAKDETGEQALKLSIDLTSAEEATMEFEEDYADLNQNSIQLTCRTPQIHCAE